MNLDNKDICNLLEESIIMVDYDGINFDIGVNNVLGDEALFKEILVMFYQDHHLDANKLQHALKEQDTASIKNIVHTLKGVTCSVGAMDLFEATKTFDIAINDNNQADFEHLFSQLSQELSRVTKAIALQLDIS